jgi:hypothetical protein
MGYFIFLSRFFLVPASSIKNRLPSIAKDWEIVTDSGNVIMNKQRDKTDSLDRFILNY